MTKFIEFEGIDGSEKTTAYNYFVEQLRARGLKVLETREVGNPHIDVCVALRKLILNPDTDISGEAMELVFGAMRIENQKFYKKVGSQYDYIVSDRGYLSHLAYTDNNCSENFTNIFYKDFLNQITDFPQGVIYLDVSPETAFNRRENRGEAPDAIEIKGQEFQIKVRDSFLKHMSQLPESIEIKTINAEESVEGVKRQLDQIINSLTISKAEDVNV